MTAYILVIGLGIGNWIYQFIQPVPDWALVFDRTFFQAVAVIAYVLLDKWMAA